MLAVIMNNIEEKGAKKAAAAKPAAPSSGLKSEGIFGMMTSYLTAGHGKIHPYHGKQMVSSSLSFKTSGIPEIMVSRLKKL